MRLDASIFGLIAWLGGTTASTTTTNTLYSSENQSPTATTPTKNPRVNFYYNQALQTHVFVVPQQPPIQVGWVVSGRLNITKASLVVVESGSETPVATATPTETKERMNFALPTELADSTNGASVDVKPISGGLFFERSSAKNSPQPAQSTGLPFNNGVDPTNGVESGSITMDSTIYQRLNLYEKLMFVSVDWIDEGGDKGRSFSTLFGLSEKVPNPDGAGPLDKSATQLQKMYGAENPYREEGPDPNSLIIKIDGVTPTAQSKTSASDSVSPTTASGDNNTAEGQSSGGKGSEGLSSGAIAGIVIGAVIGVLLIIVLAYFLCFRRRAGGKQQRRHIHGDVGYASDSGAAAMMMREKDMSGVNHGSPQSAFADDSGRLHDRGAVGHGNDSTTYSSTPPYQEERGTAAGIGTHPQQSSDSLPQNDYSLYNSGNGNGDQGTATRRPQSYAADSAIGVAVTGGASSGANAERERNGSVGGGTVGRTSYQTSRPGSEVRSPSRYAHLIEEGMTEDEIRRLEDEERQLDAAIEDAGRHGRPK